MLFMLYNSVWLSATVDENGCHFVSGALPYIVYSFCIADDLLHIKKWKFLI